MRSAPTGTDRQEHPSHLVASRIVARLTRHHDVLDRGGKAQPSDAITLKTHHARSSAADCLDEEGLERIGVVGSHSVRPAHTLHTGP